MEKSDLPCLNSLPNIDALSSYFEYIENEVLKKNIAIIFQYLIFLIALEESHKLPGAVSYLIYKDMIIHTASIAESILCYWLVKGIEKNKTTIQDMGITEEKYRDYKKVRAISDTEDVGGVIRTKSLTEPGKMQFNDLNQAALSAHIIDTVLFNELTAIRKARNKVHLSSLTTVDDSYNKANVEAMFKTVKKLITNMRAHLG